MIRRKGVVSIVVVLLGCLPLLAQDGAHARGSGVPVLSVIAGTYLSANVCGGVGLDSTQFVAQGFSVPVTVDAHDARIVLDITGDQFFLVQFTDKIGPGTNAADVLRQELIEVVNTNGGGAEAYVPLDLRLPAGEYYLVLSATDSNSGGWPFFGSGCLPKYRQLPGTIGTTDSSFYVAYGGGEDQAFPPASEFGYQAPDSPVEYQVRGGIE